MYKFVFHALCTINKDFLKDVFHNLELNAIDEF